MVLRILTVIFLFFKSLMFSQDKGNIWLKGAIIFPIKESKWSAQTEMILRSQKLYLNTDSQEYFTKGFRLWLNYRKTENLVFSFSPFSYQSTYFIVSSNDEFDAIKRSEYRFSAHAQSNFALRKRWNANFKLGFDYRTFQISQNELRARSKLGISYKIASKVKLNIYDEIFLNVTYLNSDRLIKQNRQGIDLEYVLNSDFKVSAGYLNAQKSNFDESNLLVNVIYSL